MRLFRAEPGRATEGTRLMWLGAAVLVVMGRFYPFDRFPLVTCPLRAMTGIPCPGCGMTRAFVRFTHGDWAAAVHVSPFGAALAAVTSAVVVYGILRLTILRRGIGLQLTPGETRIGSRALIGLLLVNWAYLIASGAAA